MRGELWKCRCSRRNGRLARRDATCRPLLSDLEAEIGEDQLLGLRSHWRYEIDQQPDVDHY